MIAFVAHWNERNFRYLRGSGPEVGTANPKPSKKKPLHIYIS